MAAPLEIRQYVRLITMAELEAGVVPIRQNGRLYHPPITQYRWREKQDGGTVWSAWADVGFEREEP